MSWPVDHIAVYHSAAISSGSSLTSSKGKPAREKIARSDRAGVTGKSGNDRRSTTILSYLTMRHTPGTCRLPSVWTEFDAAQRTESGILGN